MIQSCVLLGTLGIHSIEDIRKKKITITITLFSAILGVVLHLCFQNQSIYSMLAGMLSGGVIVGISRITGGMIGMGDGMVFMLTGLYLGVEKNLSLMFLSFALAGVWALISMILFHKKKNDRIPFVPFLFISYVILILI